MADTLNINDGIGSRYSLEVVHHGQALYANTNIEPNPSYDIITTSFVQRELSLLIHSTDTSQASPSISVGAVAYIAKPISVSLAPPLATMDSPLSLVIDQPIKQMFTLAIGISQGPSATGDATDTFESVSKNLASLAFSVARTGDQITSISYSNGVIKTFGYGGPGGLPNTITLSGSIPSGIHTIKTIIYTGNKPTGVVYS